MPWTKCADKTREDFTLRHTQLATNNKPANAGTKLFGIDAVRINHNLFVRNSGAQKVATFHVRNDEDTGRGFQVQMLESRQQRQHFPSIPVPAHPNFRPVVFEEQRPTGAQAGSHSDPAKASITLVDQINRSRLDLWHRARGKNQVVAQVKSRAG